MTLEEYVKDRRERGEMPKNMKPREAFVKVLNSYLKDKDKKSDDLMSRLFGKDVVIHTSEGYHYGRLEAYNGKEFMLGRYHFDRNRLTAFEYAFSSVSGEDSVIPANDVISVSKVPAVVREMSYN